ncbi:MAG: hypothetical protein LBU65_13445, partial [Planctomycetaceae bacterium]|nr:hypothetical protein [Planctomycetaceae bacterium]
MTQFPDCELGEAPVRFGVVPYTNTLPLTHFIPELLPSSTMIQYLPSQLLFRLVSHHIDVALMPVASLMDLPSGVILG